VSGLRILITNDDGIHADGLAALERIAEAVGSEVWVVAPENDQSGFAHSLTLHDPLRVRDIAERRFAVRGTPTDCVIMAVKQLMPEPPDVILSGVNHGQNAADDVTYSGTVAAAIEGTLLGITSIALSQAYNFEEAPGDVPFATAVHHGPDLIRRLLEAGIPKQTLINVNFPNCPADAVAGVEVTRQGVSIHGLRAEARVDVRNRPYYWLTYTRQHSEPAAGTDRHAMANRRISVTPLRLDMTDDAGLERLRAAMGG
jgi:5'-nucleotidase